MLQILMITLQVVTSSVLPTTTTTARIIVGEEPEEEMIRVRRQMNNEWVKICPTEEDIIPLVAATDDEGRDILELAVTGNVEYQELVRVERCRDNVAHVGGVTVKCEQEYLEHTIVVYNTDTGQEILQRTFFYPSGCSARVTQPS